jgi:hypothetical protein
MKVRIDETRYREESASVEIDRVGGGDVWTDRSDDTAVDQDVDRSVWCCLPRICEMEAPPKYEPPGGSILFDHLASPQSLAIGE